MPHCRRLLTVLGLLCCAGVAPAGELGHYAAGLSNVRDYFLPPPDIYYLQYNYLYTTNRLNNRDGDRIDTLTHTGPAGTTTVGLDVDVDIVAIAPVLIWSTEHKFLGARYGAYVAPSFANNSLQGALSISRDGTFIDGSLDRSGGSSEFGFGDPLVVPVWLDWSGKHYDLATSYGVYAPIGEDGISLDFWTHQFQLAGAWYPWEHRGTAVTLAGTYEIHGDMEGKDLTPGDRFTLDWGISQYVPFNKDMTWLGEIGILGYAQWQVERDSGSDVRQLPNRSLDAKDEAYAAGLQLGLTYVPAKSSLTLRFENEFHSEARFEGLNLVMTFVKGF